LSPKALQCIDRHANLADFIGFYGRFAIPQNPLAGFLLFGFKQAAELQECPLRVFD
jgi:hypothetical protein